MVNFPASHVSELGGAFEANTLMEDTNQGWLSNNFSLPGSLTASLHLKKGLLNTAIERVISTFSRGAQTTNYVNKFRLNFQCKNILSTCSTPAFYTRKVEHGTWKWWFPKPDSPNFQGFITKHQIQFLQVGGRLAWGQQTCKATKAQITHTTFHQPDPWCGVWAVSCFHSVDGSEILRENQLRLVVYPGFFPQGFTYPGWLLGISSINKRINFTGVRVELRKQIGNLDIIIIFRLNLCKMLMV